jgi:PAS domain S-box-containing protein
VSQDLRSTSGAQQGLLAAQESRDLVARIASLSVFALTCSVLVGWGFDIPGLRSLAPGMVSMKVNTALSLAAVSMSLWLQSRTSAGPLHMRCARAFGVLAVAIGFATLSQHLFGFELGIDQLVLRVPAGEPYASHPGRMSVSTALGLIAIGSAVSLLASSGRIMQAFGQGAALVACAIALLALVRYAFGVHELYGVDHVTGTALHTAAGLLVLGFGALAVRPRSRLLRVRDGRLRTKLAALLLLTSLVPLVVYASIENDAIATQALDTSKTLLVARGKQLAAQLDGWNRSHLNAAERLAHALAAIGCCGEADAIDSAAIRGMLSSHAASEPDEIQAAILDGSGRFVLSSRGWQQAARFTQLDALRAALSEPVVSEVHFAPSLGVTRPALAFLAPIMTRDARLGGLAAIWIDAAELSKLTVRAERSVEQGGETLLLDREGVVIAGSSDSLALFRPAGVLPRQVVQRAVREHRFEGLNEIWLNDVRSLPQLFAQARAPAPAESVFLAFDPPANTWSYAVARRLNTAPWTVFATLPTASVSQAIAPITRRTMLLAGCVITLALLAGAFLARDILAPLGALAEATERLARGELSARVAATTADEIGELGRSFDAMAARIESQAAALRGANEQLEARVQRRTAELREREQDLATTLDSIGDAVIATDRATRVVRMNGVAERLTGWTASEAHTHTLQDVFRILDEGTRAWAKSPATKVLSASSITGLADHAILVARDGHECPIAHSAAPIVGADGEVRGVVLVFRDVGDERAAAEALRASEAKYRELYENLADMCATFDFESEVIVECNETMARQLGYTKAELLGRPAAEIYADMQAPARAADREKFQSVLELHDRERVLKRKDGSTLETSLSVTGARDARGKLLAKAVFRDVSARRELERDRQFLADLNDLQGSADVVDLTYRVSERLAKYLRVGRAAFIEGDPRHNRLMIQRDYHGEDAAPLAGYYPVDLFGDGDDQRAGRTTVIGDTTIDPRTRERSSRVYAPIDVRAVVSVPLLREGRWVASLTVGDARPRAWQQREVVLIQATAGRTWLWVEQRRLSAVLREKELTEVARARDERFRILVEGVKEYVILLLDAAGHVVSWTQEAQRIMGYEEAEIIGRHYSLFFVEEDRARGLPDDILTRAANDGRHGEEGFCVRKDGSRFWADTLVTALHDGAGNLEGYAQVTRDSTERRRAEEVLHERQAELTASLKEREVLLQEVHHRVKNNLQVISSLINMQRRTLTDEASREALEECRSRVAAIALIHEKLYVSKDYANVPFSDYARGLCMNIFDALGISRARIALEVDVESLSFAVDKAIPCGLVMNELITNSMKHAFPNERRGTITVEMKRVGSHVRLKVSDDGVGIPIDFDPDKSESLGMQLVSTLVTQLRGKLTIARNDNGVGSVFSVDFAADDAA